MDWYLSENESDKAGNLSRQLQKIDEELWDIQREIDSIDGTKIAPMKKDR